MFGLTFETFGKLPRWSQIKETLQEMNSQQKILQILKVSHAYQIQGST